MTLVDGEGRHRMKGLWGGRNQHGGVPGCANPSNALEDRAGVVMTLLRAPGASARYSGDRPARARIASGKNGRLDPVPTAFSGLAIGSALGWTGCVILDCEFLRTIQDSNHTSSALGGKQNQVEMEGTLGRSGAFKTRSRGPKSRKTGNKFYW
ncbi:hypothetical protein N7474_003454 [Penicillium riverlandense]|uniref:uncharacterized protein n=1 Tax=Penicillium riverlandense TaxID=1903569 RepID=UPI0025476B91|nr:uncharacterized protein N7474_003454 [Penicillium riverlandense]KAJ5826316.1 hypothetical protein N7474_003454 [Penicillium riverlandense]